MRSRCIYFFSNRCLHKVKEEDIFFIRLHQGVCYLHTRHGVYKVHTSLRSFEGNRFHVSLSRSHRSVVVNMQHVTGMGFRSIFVNGMPLPLDPMYHKRLYPRFCRST